MIETESLDFLPDELVQCVRTITLPAPLISLDMRSFSIRELQPTGYYGTELFNAMFKVITTHFI